MKRNRSLRNVLAAAASTSAALALLVCATPRAAQATTTSAGATVYNKVTVTYASGTVTGLQTSSSVKVTVTTLAAAPTITVDATNASILSGDAHLYTYTIKSNSNGTDTYTVTRDSSSSDSANMGSPNNADSIPSTQVVLWGAYAVGSGAGYIEVPGGSTTGAPLVAGTSTVLLNVGGTAQAYTVASITLGAAASDGAGESYDKVYLTPISGATPIAGNVSAGTQVGEYKTVQNTVTAGNVNIDTSNTTISNGTHVTELHVVTSATNASNNPVSYTTSTTDGNAATTTILAPKLSILKESKNYTVVGDLGSYATSGTTARPGEVIEYRITITNLHTVVGAKISAAKVADTLPSYTTYVAGSTKIAYNGAAATPVADVSGKSPLDGAGYDLPTALDATQYAYIYYRATVN